ncbi:PRC-barrel domain-containing protein [uncultured Clostridium sp.]|uniref:PRC-barrel domain-containing protein n=1 Tax=uncultured Clostridium sp. TaxID=59620 RepID=UPI0025F10E44|nr:PRC-barrel domain-containing protein [uncultured Clostridium sp.]
MFKSKDLYMKNIYDLNGKKVGTSKEILIDFYTGRVLGLEINTFGFKNDYVDIKDIIQIDEEILIKKVSEIKGIRFSDIRDMEVIDRLGNSKGVVEDLLIEEESYDIKGIILNSGIIDTLLKGKEVILINNSVLGEEYILYLGQPNIVFKNIPHEINRNENVKKAY